jgi:hypothetical protein
VSNVAEKTLAEVGFEGGTRNDPRIEILEYDYKVHLPKKGRGVGSE